ncbi:MAG: YigZ family protein [Prolixibacteraceae bacterium]
MINDTYLSIEEKCEGLFKDKGSKFIAFAFPVDHEETIKTILQEIKKEHYSARHHCYAYRLGPEGEYFRANDDGEPSGTAGRPILGQLLSKQLTNILVVVVRYFGGTLLGVSGLINAYKNATIDVISQSQLVTHIIDQKYLLEFDYPLQNSIMRIIKDDDLPILQAKYEMNCQLTLSIRLNKAEEVLAKFNKIDQLKMTLFT